MNKKELHGFTLIELMIVLFISVLLVTIAYPSYITHLLKSHRSDAFTSLLADQIALEQCYAYNSSYDKTCDLVATHPHPSAQGYYIISLTHITPQNYLLVASTVGNQTKDTACSSFSVTPTNKKIALDFLGNEQAHCFDID